MAGGVYCTRWRRRYRRRGAIPAPTPATGSKYAYQGKKEQGLHGVFKITCWFMRLH